MDLLTFIAEVIEALAWPVAVLIIFLSMRRPLMGLIPYLQRLRYRDLELDFDVQMRELVIRAQQELPPGPPPENSAGISMSHLEELAQLSPRAVVLESWLGLEKAAIDATRRRGLSLSSREMKAPILLGQAMVDAGILDESKQAIFHRLRNLRNAAAHASEFAFDPASAMEYAELSARLADYIVRS